jgi:DNA-binding LytR/AlgR family response regulator
MNIGSIENMVKEAGFARISRSVIINLRYLEKINRLKRSCIVKKGEEVFHFEIPLNRIRSIEKLI